MPAETDPQHIVVTRQQRVAREWLIFLGCVIAGLFVTYLAIYANAPVYDYSREQVIKYKNPGDMFNVLMAPFGERRNQRHLDDDFVNQWLLTLCPYFVVNLLRSVVWSVRTLKGKPTKA
jgi:hypothetical protein